jgi:hypothetical protein
VEITLTLGEEEISRTFGSIDVDAKGFAGEYTVSPRSVHLQLFGPRSIIEKIELGKEQVYLNLKGLAPGLHSVRSALIYPGVKVTLCRNDLKSGCGAEPRYLASEGVHQCRHRVQEKEPSAVFFGTDGVRG